MAVAQRCLPGGPRNVLSHRPFSLLSWKQGWGRTPDPDQLLPSASDLAAWQGLPDRPACRREGRGGAGRPTCLRLPWTELVGGAAARQPHMTLCAQPFASPAEGQKAAKSSAGSTWGPILQGPVPGLCPSLKSAPPSLLLRVGGWRHPHGPASAVAGLWRPPTCQLEA